MNKPIFTALSSNTERDDVWLAFKLLFQPWQFQKGRSTDLFKKNFQEKLSSDHVFFFESGRSSLYAIIQALDLQKDDEVLLQSFTCIAVPEPVIWLGAKPVYVDCDEETFTMSLADLEKKVTPKSKVLIIQHTFGFAADLEKLLEFAKKHKLFVIEDCAHSLGASYKGKLLGTFGDASFFSFGRDKIISCIFGGAVTVKNPQLAAKIEVLYTKCSLPSLLWILQQLLHPVLMTFAKKTFQIFIGKLIMVVGLKVGFLSKAVNKEEREGLKPNFIFKKLPNALAALAYNQFKKLDKYNDHRCKIAALYAQSLPHIKAQKALDGAPPIFLRYTLCLPQAHQMLNDAPKSRIYLGDWYTSGLAPLGVHYDKLQYDPKLCPNAEKLAQECVNLPTHIQISPEGAQRVISFIKNYVASH